MSSEAILVLSPDEIDIVQLSNDFPVQQFIEGLAGMGIDLWIKQDSLCG